VNIEKTILAPGLYFVATPIGSARDITLRALDILASADVLAAEDTRTLRHLMQIHGVPLGDRQIIAYHDHNGTKARPKLISLLQNGKSVAYASEAGTPLVADPGFQLAKAAIDEGLVVTSAPGPSAVITALSIAGLPTDRFLFAGFPPSSKSARKTWLKELLNVNATLVIYESAKRIHKVLDVLCDIGASERQVAVCRELTKRFEEVRRGTALELVEEISSVTLKGEIVFLIDRDRSERSDVLADGSLEDALIKALKVMKVKDAATAVAQDLDLPRRTVYQAALALGRKE